MNLYRLDATDGPLCDILGPMLIRSYQRAMDIAHDHATEHNETVIVTRISGGGALKKVATVHPGRGDLHAFHRTYVGRSLPTAEDFATAEANRPRWNRRSTMRLPRIAEVEACGCEQCF